MLDVLGPIKWHKVDIIKARIANGWESAKEGLESSPCLKRYATYCPFKSMLLMPVRQPECVRGKIVRSKFEEDFYLSENGQPIILRSMPDRVLIQSVTGSLIYECR